MFLLSALIFLAMGLGVLAAPAIVTAEGHVDSATIVWPQIALPVSTGSRRELPNAERLKRVFDARADLLEDFLPASLRGYMIPRDYIARLSPAPASANGWTFEGCYDAASGQGGSYTVVSAESPADAVSQCVTWAASHSFTDIIVFAGSSAGTYTCAGPLTGASITEETCTTTDYAGYTSN